jgi:hypothetical protein
MRFSKVRAFANINRCLYFGIFPSRSFTNNVTPSAVFKRASTFASAIFDREVLRDEGIIRFSFVLFVWVLSQR